MVGEDQERHAPDSHVFSGVRYYTGIYDPNRRPEEHAAMARRLHAYADKGILVFPIPSATTEQDAAERRVLMFASLST